jgi:nicotinamidase/pyrazinamidase
MSEKELRYPLLSIDREHSCSFDCDCQKGFTPLCPDELPVPDGHLIVEELNKNATHTKYRLGSKDLHPYNALWETTDSTLIGKPLPATFDPPKNVDLYWPRHCVIGTYGCELLDGLPAEVEYDFFAYKGVNPDSHPYGACYHDLQNKQSTGLIEWLKYNNVNTVLLGGLALDFCVKTTAIQLRRAKFSVIINLASTKAISEKGKDDTMFELIVKYGVLFINTADEITEERNALPVDRTAVEDY